MRLWIVRTASAAAPTIIARRIIGPATPPFGMNIVASTSAVVTDTVIGPASAMLAKVIAAAALPHVIGRIVGTASGGGRVGHGNGHGGDCRKQRDSRHAFHKFSFLRPAIC